MIEVRRAQALHAVATHGSVTAAAAALHVTSSALSQQLAKLEREVGQPLLVHRGRGVALTDAGALLTRHTEDILARIAQAETDLQALRGEVTGRMAIAAFATAARALLPPALAELTDRYPSLQVTSRENEPEESLELLARGELDLAVIDEWPHTPRPLPTVVTHAHLFDDVADLAMPTGHRLARAEAAPRLADCEGEPWISWTAGQFGHGWLARTLSGANVEPDIRHTAGEHQTLLALVAAGLGLALMPRLGRGPVPEGVTVRELRPPVTRKVHLVWRTDTTDRPAVQAAKALLQQHVSRAIQPQTLRPHPER